MTEIAPQKKEQKQSICKIIIQQCEKANLSFDTSDPPVSIERGMVIFVCFLQGATESSLNQIVSQIMNVKLCETESGSRVSTKSFPGPRFDLLVIPQATLGGKLKGKTLQYHAIIDKSIGADLFAKLVEKLKTENKEIGNVQAGIYGARQILSTETNGPYTHIFEF